MAQILNFYLGLAVRGGGLGRLAGVGLLAGIGLLTVKPGGAAMLIPAKRASLSYPVVNCK